MVSDIVGMSTYVLYLCRTVGGWSCGSCATPVAAAAACVPPSSSPWRGSVCNGGLGTDNVDAFIAAWREAPKLSRRGLRRTEAIGLPFAGATVGRPPPASLSVDDGSPLTLTASVARAAGETTFTLEVFPLAFSSCLFTSSPPPRVELPPKKGSILLQSNLGCDLPVLSRALAVDDGRDSASSPRAIQLRGRSTLVTAGRAPSVEEHEADDVGLLLSHLVASSSVIGVLSSLLNFPSVSSPVFAASTVAAVVVHRCINCGRASAAVGSSPRSRPCSLAGGRAEDPEGLKSAELAGTAVMVVHVLLDNNCVLNGEFGGATTCPSSNFFCWPLMSSPLCVQLIEGCAECLGALNQSIERWNALHEC